MQTSRAFWPAWAEHLHAWKMTAFAAWLLEAAGPLTLLGSQALYFVNPFFGGKQLKALAHILEEDDELQAFTSYLRQETYL